MTYKWQDDFVIDGKLKDGWYYIKLDTPFISYQKRAFDEVLPPTRCVYVEGSVWSVSPTPHGIQGFSISPDMIESPAFTVGEEYEFSDWGKDWYKRNYMGYVYGNVYPHRSNSAFGYASVSKYCRPIQKVSVDRKIELLYEAREDLKKFDEYVRDMEKRIKEVLEDD